MQRCAMQASITTAQMKAHFIAYFTKKGTDLSAIDWDYWLLGEGLPDWDLVRYVIVTSCTYCRCSGSGERLAVCSFGVPTANKRSEHADIFGKKRTILIWFRRGRRKTLIFGQHALHYIPNTRNVAERQH
jgi:hypothetical protein